MEGVVMQFMQFILGGGVSALETTVRLIVLQRRHEGCGGDGVVMAAKGRLPSGKIGGKDC